MMTLDDIDRKILRILQENARTSLKTIAEKTFLSSPAVSARIEKMEKDGIIIPFSAETKQVMTEVEDIRKDMAHKPFHPESEAYQRFLGQIVLKIERLIGKYPYLDFQKETELCHIRLNP